MNKPLLAIETIVAVPVMTKREKLMRLAKLARQCTHNLFAFNGLEYNSPAQLEHLYHPLSVFALANADPIFRDAGLKSDRVGDAKRFFGLNSDELHAFSCDCGGHISNQAMARRIETIAST
jgi:hypothetical protein